MRGAFGLGFEILTTAGGVAIILLGGAQLRKALDRLFGPRLEGWVRALARHRGQAVVTGLGVSLLAPSSTTMALLAVHTVQAGQATPRQMLALMLGAGVGLTVTIQLVALNLTHYAPVIVLLGFLLSRGRLAPRTRQVGKIVLGLGFIFLGIATAQAVLAAGSADAGALTASLDVVAQRAWTLVVAGLALALATQSTTATIVVILAFVQAGRVELPGAIAWVVGANLAIGATVLLSGWQRLASRRLGIAFLTAQVLGAAVVLARGDDVARLLLLVPEPRLYAVANAHTGFNLAVALVGLALLGPLDRAAALLAPARAPAAGERYAAHDIGDRPPESLALALAQARAEIHRLGELIAEDLEAVWRGVAALDGAASDAVRAARPTAERHFARLTTYLGRLSGDDGQDEGAASPPLALARILADLEVVYHVAANDLARLARRLQQGPVRFSAAGARELDDYARRVIARLHAFLDAFATGDGDAARRLATEAAALDEEAEQLRDRHLERVRRGLPASVESDVLHLDLLTFLRLVAQQLGRLASSLADLAR